MLDGERPYFHSFDIINPFSLTTLYTTAVALKASGYDVSMYTSFYDPERCFAETRDGTFPVHVHGNWSAMW